MLGTSTSGDTTIGKKGRKKRKRNSGLKPAKQFPVSDKIKYTKKAQLGYWG